MQEKITKLRKTHKRSCKSIINKSPKPQTEMSDSNLNYWRVQSPSEDPDLK